MYFYTIYGLNICSNSIIDIAQQTSPQQKVDVYIDVKYTSELSTKEYISIEEVDNESYIISMPNIARYIITENKISCCSNSYESFISTLFNMPFSILLLLRNEVLLHVSSLASKQGLILISGCKGKGKSTLTAMLSNTNSFEFFADDTIRVNKDSNGYGAHSYIKLYPSKETWLKLYKINKAEDIKHNIINALIMIVNVSSEFLVLTLSVFDVVNKYIGIGDLQYNLSMVSRLREQSQGLMNNINRFLSDNTRLIELQEFMDIEPEVEKSGTLKPSNNPKIEFCDVSFRYPNSEQYVLKDCSFTIEPHEKVGLIGLNGAGKSTIIKLMFRFYDPERGCIKLDGIDLKEYDVYAVRKIFGVLFQDYVTYCLPLREIIALSDFDERFNDEKLRRACDISGANEVIKDWEDGFDSVLGRYYTDNGKDLSGGQWQLIGLARAYFKDSEFMILDEPSAALDPISEDRIFKQLYNLSKGKSSVTISHRLSNTTLADKILVIEDGCIIEQGSHNELMRQNGKYAHLFKLQANRYK